MASFLRFFVKDVIFPLFLLLIVFFVSYKNFTPYTFLSGWDNLMPELNLWENIRRSFSVFWQEYQGLGLLGGMAHAADLPRQIVLSLFSLFLPISLLRYSWAFLMLFAGPLGVYFLIYRVVLEKDNLISRLAGLVGAFFYLFNLATVQYFFVPFEAFVSFYGFLPWFLYFALKYFKKGLKKDLVFYVLISFWGATSFYVQTLFVVYFAFLIVFSLEAILRFKKKGFFRAVSLLFFTFAIHSFWLLPVFYFTLTSSSVPSLSHINSIATPETQLMNQAAGEWRDVWSLKGFWFNYYDFFVGEGLDYLFKDWLFWTGRSEIFWISISLAAFSFFGILSLIFRRKTFFGFSFLILSFVGYIMLASRNFPFGAVFVFLENNIPLFGEIFRSVFTKWSVAFAFVLSSGLGAFVSVFDIFRQRILKVSLSLVFTLIFLSLNIFAVWPVFEGKLIASKMRVSLPNDYFQVIRWFNEKSDGRRVAILPFVNHWGWVFTSWGYSGSGFLWYGVKNPILDRAFDVWSPYNESFYNEASSTLYKYHLIDLDRVRPCQDKKDCKREEELKEGIEKWNKEVVSEFEKVLEKYNVSYLLLDESVVNAGGDGKILYFKQIKDLFDKSSRIEKVAQFGFLTVYHFSSWTGSDPVQTPGNFFSINSDLKYSKYDYIYQNYGEYVSEDEGLSAPAFPFVNFDPRAGVSFRILDEGEEETLLVENKEYSAKVVLPVVEKIEEKFGEDQGFKEGYNCDLKKKGTAVKKRLSKGNFYGAYDGGVSCDWFYYPGLDRSRAWLMRIKGKNLAGRSLKVYLQNLRTGRMDLEELLKADKNGDFDSYFVIYPSESKEVYEFTKSYEHIPEGYTLNIETRSFGKIMSENIIEDITFIPIDIDWFYQLTTFKGGSLKGEQNNLEVLGVKKYGTWGYKVQVGFDSRSLNNARYGILVLPQGFDKGWVALEIPNSKSEIRGYKLLKHLKVNSWANGWMIPADDSKSGEGSFEVFIFFWPQVLQWIGFLIVGILVLLLIVSDGKKRQKQRLARPGL